MNETVIFTSEAACAGAQKSGATNRIAVAKSKRPAHRRSTGAVRSDNLFVRQNSTDAAYTGGRRNAIAAWVEKPLRRLLHGRNL